MPQVSVIIPTYNRAHLIRETLESVTAQTHHDFHVIVVDDGSTDDTPDVLRDYSNCIEYHRISHSGQSAARNIGLERSSGEYIAFLDSDDVWDNRFLEVMTQALDNSSGAGFAFCDYGTFEEGGVIQETFLPKGHKVQGDIFAHLLQVNFLCTGALLIRRVCFDEIGGFDPDLPLVEDWDLWLRLARKFKAKYIDEPLLHIRLNPLNPSRNPLGVYPLNLRVLEKMRRDFPDETRRFRPILQRQSQHFHLALANYFRVHRRPLPALKHIALMVSARFL